MSRPVILITTGRNVYSLRAYDAILAACVRLNLQFDVAHVDKERLTAKPVQTLLRHPLCVKKHVVKSNLIQEYRALSGFAAERDIRPELAKMYERIIPKLLKDNAEFVKALDEEGRPLEGMGFMVSRDGGLDLVTTKGAVDGYWGNYTMYGAVGTYTVRMFDESDSVTGVGFGVETWPHDWAQTSFRLVFQLGGQPPVEPEPPDVTEALAEMRVLEGRWGEVVGAMELVSQI